MLKIGMFTFGGGYAMISLLENEFVTKKKYLENDEFLDMVAIAESTPGPIAVNASTYIGYKVAGVLGAIFCTLGVCIPSFVIIFVISLFFNQFLAIEWVAKAFKGVQIGVIFLIASSGVKMLIKLKKTPFNIIVAITTFGCMLAFTIFAIDFSAIFYILIAGVLGLLVYLIGLLYNRKKQKSACATIDNNDNAECATLDNNTECSLNDNNSDCSTSDGDEGVQE